MDVKELRIGNFVYDSIGKAKTVFSIDNFECDLDESKTSVIKNYTKDLKPIPITEDWLLKFGFVKLNNRHEFVHGENEPHMSICCEDNYFLFFVEDEISYNTIRKELKNVHQLQNLYFALTGEELTMN